MNILLTASFANGLFCNGLQQNIVFLAEMLKDMNYNVAICINHPISECSDPPTGILIMEEDEIDSEFNPDFVLQTGFVLRDSTIDGIKNKNHRCKNIHVHYGNRMLADIEQCKWDTMAITDHKVDEIWVSPHYEISIPYFKAFYHTQKVHIIPYIWSPKYIDIHRSIYIKRGKDCKYIPGQEKNIAIVEPNLNMTKNCLPAILIAEELIQDQPDLFNKLYVYCSSSIMEKRYFRGWMWNLDLPKLGKVQFSGRNKISDIFANDANVVISHHLMNALNYTHLESIYLDIPLVHNSEYMKDSGYYYPDYDIQKGASRLMEALTYHDESLDEYRKKAKSTLHRFSPDNELVRAKYRLLFL